MTSWAARMHRRAATFSNVVTSCGHPSGPYPRRLEKVKFGASLEEVCKNDIPAPLLVLILKLNKEAPYRKDVFRAPGHQGAMKKLIHFLQTGRIINIDNFSVYTIASVLKKFLRKIPGGIFGREVEQRFFETLEMTNSRSQQIEIENIITALPVYTQRLLVLLFGTFRVIACNSEKAGTGMTSEALGVSVAPSFFHSCVSDGKAARMEDVMKFKVASRVVKFLIEQFANSFLFGRDNYEFYSRVTGRVLRVQGEWICSFQYPPMAKNAAQHICPKECVPLESYLLVPDLAQMEECQATATLLKSVMKPQVSTASLGIITERIMLESCTRLSVSLEQNGLFQGHNTSYSSSTSHSSKNSQNYSGPRMTLEELRDVNRYAESTRSLSYLPQVHERQTERMKTRSQWFLTPAIACTSCGSMNLNLSDSDISILTNAILRRSSSDTVVGSSLSAESIQRKTSMKRPSFRDKHFPDRPRNSRNRKSCSKSHSFKGRRKGSISRQNSLKLKSGDLSRSCHLKTKTDSNDANVTNDICVEETTSH